MFSPVRMIGLDIGESSIKLIELEKTKDVVRVVDFALLDTANGKASQVSEHDIAKDILSRVRVLAEKRRFANVSCVVGISGIAVFLRFVKLPAVEKSKMDQIVKYEAQQQVPFPIEEVRWSYQLLGKTSREERDIVLVAIKQDIVRSLVNSVVETGLMPEVIDVLPLSLYNCLVYNGLPANEPTLVMEMGAKSTNLIVVEEDNLWIRSIPIAGNSITQCIAEDLKIGFKEAEKLKIDAGIKTPAISGETGQKLYAAIDRGAGRLFAEISRSLGFYKTQFGGNPVKKIFIAGGGSLLVNLDSALSERFKIKVERINPFKKLGIENFTIQRKEELLRNRHLLCNAVGLALRGVAKLPLRINLIPQGIINNRMIVKKFAFFAASFLTILVMLFSVRVVCMKTAIARMICSKDLSAYISHLEVLNKQLKGVNDEVGVINNKMNVISRLINARDCWMKIFVEIQKVMAPNTWIVNLYGNIDDAGTVKPGVKPRTRTGSAIDTKKPEDYAYIYIDGKGKGSIEKDIPLFRDALEKSPFFKDVDIISAEMNNGFIIFTVRMKFEKKIF